MLVRLLDRHPPVGLFIAVLGLLAAVVPLLRDRIGKYEKAAWTLLMFLLVILEVRTIYAERNEQNKQFAEIAAGIKTSIDASQNQFSATMARLETVTAKEETNERLTRRNLNQLTGGGQFCYLMAILPLGVSGGKAVFQLAKMNSGPLPLDVCHVIIHESFQPKSAQDAERLMQAIVDKQLGPLPPGTGAKVQGPQGFGTDIALPEGSYYIQINTRNDRFYETLTIHPNVKGKGLEDIEVRDEKWQVVYADPKPSK